MGEELETIKSVVVYIQDNINTMWYILMVILFISITVCLLTLPICGGMLTAIYKLFTGNKDINVLDVMKVFNEMVQQIFVQTRVLKEDLPALDLVFDDGKANIVKNSSRNIYESHIDLLNEKIKIEKLNDELRGLKKRKKTVVGKSNSEDELG